LSGEDQILEMIGRVSKSVVNINTLKVLQDYFYRTVPVKGMGSGFVFDDRGYILTNNHVISDAERIVVTLENGKSVSGRIVGTLRSNDLAVVKIGSDQPKSVELGNSDELKVGQRVFAIGNPFGLPGGPTVTSGVISALNRTITGEEGSFTGLVQTDAAINPGNSGGPLIDTGGRVVAICTAIIPYAQGIGFAVPVNAAKDFSREIIQYGATVRPWLGITGLSINPGIAENYNLPVERGVFVASIASDSPAEKAGLAQGDIILEFDSVAMDTIETLQRSLQRKKAGEVADITIMRGRRRGRLEVELERMP